MSRCRLCAVDIRLVKCRGTTVPGRVRCNPVAHLSVISSLWALVVALVGVAQLLLVLLHLFAAAACLRLSQPPALQSPSPSQVQAANLLGRVTSHAKQRSSVMSTVPSLRSVIFRSPSCGEVSGSSSEPDGCLVVVRSCCSCLDDLAMPFEKAGRSALIGENLRG